MKFNSLKPKADAFIGLETFTNPGVTKVTATSDEVTAVCPVTGQPDWYTITIEYTPQSSCIESKSLKLYLQTYRNVGMFCEELSEKIRKDIVTALDTDTVKVTIVQKSRGGITITAVSGSISPQQ